MRLPADSKKFPVNKILWVVFVLYSVLVIMGAVSHESWADEAQSWLLARDLSLNELFKVLPSEGHPPLWYLIIFPFAKLGLPYETIKYIAALAMMAAMYLFIFKTRTHIIAKICLPFGYYFFYLYAVFGRSYALAVFFTMAVAALYPDRFRKPWIFAVCVICLANTHVLVFSFCQAIIFIYILDTIQAKKLTPRTIAATALMLVGSAYLIPYLGFSSVATYLQHGATDPSANFRYILVNISPYFDSEIPGVILLICIALPLITRPKAFVIFVCGLAGIFYLLTYRYSFGQPRHYGMIYAVIAGSYAIVSFYNEDKLNFLQRYTPIKYGYWACALLALTHVPVSVYNYRYDLNGIYSGSKDVAEYLHDNWQPNTMVIAESYWSGIAVLPYMSRDVQFYDAKCNRFSTYLKYDSCFTHPVNIQHGESVFIAKNHFPARMKNMLFLFDFEIAEKVDFLELVYKTPEAPLYNAETYCIYKFKNVPSR